MSVSGQDLAPEDDEAHDEQRQSKLGTLIYRISELPDIDGVMIGDPRFRWFGSGMDPRPSGETSLLDALRRYASDPSASFDEREERLRHLIEYGNDLVGQPLEGELAGILGPAIKRQAGDSRRITAITRRLGWDGQPAGTLEEVAVILGVTRERIRQLQVAIEAELKSTLVWTPVLDRAVRILAREAPIPFDHVGVLLHRAGLAESRDFSAGSILHAQGILMRTRRLEELEAHGIQFLVRVGDSPSLNWVGTTRTAIQKELGNQGIVELDSLMLAHQNQVTATQVRTIAHWSSSWQIIDGNWIVQTDLDVRNPLYNRIRKVLAIRHVIALDCLHAQILRDTRARRTLHTSLASLRVFIAWHPELILDARDQVTSVTPVQIDDVLSDSELILWRSLSRSRHPRKLSHLVAEFEAHGLTRPAAILAVTYSPVVIKVARNEYQLVGFSDDD